MQAQSKQKVVLVQAPCIRSTFLPPAGVPCLLSYLKSHGYEASAIDGDMIYKKHLPVYRFFTGSHRFLIAASKLVHRRHNTALNQATYGFSTAQGPAWATAVAEAPRPVASLARNPVQILFKRGFALLRWGFLMVDRTLQGLAERAVFEPDLQVDQVLSSFDTNYKSEEKRMERALGPAIADANGDIIGISVQYPDQMLLSLLLAKVAKKVNPDCRVVLGGPQITSQIALIKEAGQVTKYVDGLMVHEADLGLCKLVDAWRSGGALDEIENLYYRDGDIFTASKRVDYQMPVAEYTVPDFTGFNLADYRYGLPIRTLRGCYYNKCTFCTYPVTGGQYAFTSANFVVDNMAALQEKYKVSNFELIDSSLPAKYLRQIADMIIERGLKMTWYTRANVQRDFKDAELVKLLAKSGLTELYLGVESGNDRIVDLMKKMQPGKAESLAVVESLYTNGVQPRTYSMFGYPSETKEEMEESVEFFMELNRRFQVGVKAANQFNLVTDSPMFYDPEPYGIVNINGSTNAAQGYGYEFQVLKGMTPAEARKLCKKAGIFFRHPILANLHKKVYGRTL